MNPSQDQIIFLFLAITSLQYVLFVPDKEVSIVIAAVNPILILGDVVENLLMTLRGEDWLREVRGGQFRTCRTASTE